MEFKLLVFISVAYLWCFIGTNCDKPCIPMPVHNRSVVCVCNTTYCDTVTRISPTSDTFITYTSSENGLRFKMTKHEFNTNTGSADKDSATGSCSNTLLLHPDVMYQAIRGFGGAVTDSAGLNWKSLPESLQKDLIDSYFSEKGLQYNMIRVPIGGTDFSTHGYAFNERPENDPQLSNFTLAYEDYEYKLPMIKAAVEASSTEIFVLGTTWSPPLWMKKHRHYTGFNTLKHEYSATYALYHLRFIEEYEKSGIKIWGITLTNEPINGIIGIPFVPCLGWTADTLAPWVIDHLGPAIRNSKYKDTLLLAGDDQRITIPYWINYMFGKHPKIVDYVDAIAVHYYTDNISPPDLLTEIGILYPDKFIIATEACTGSGWLDKDHVDLGSWQRAKIYAKDIIQDLNHGVAGWIDWNMCLNEVGGPTWTGNRVDSPIIVFSNNNTFVKQPMFYAMGHFSKFIPRDSRRIKTTSSDCWPDSISHVAFITPGNTIVMVIYNDSDSEKTVNIKIKEKLAVVDTSPHSITTIELPMS